MCSFGSFRYENLVISRCFCWCILMLVVVRLNSITSKAEIGGIRTHVHDGFKIYVVRTRAGIIWKEGVNHDLT